MAPSQPAMHYVIIYLHIAYNCLKVEIQKGTRRWRAPACVMTVVCAPHLSYTLATVWSGVLFRATSKHQSQDDSSICLRLCVSHLSHLSRSLYQGLGQVRTQHPVLRVKVGGRSTFKLQHRMQLPRWVCLLDQTPAPHATAH